MNTLLKGDDGFRGFIMSDYNATPSTVQAANSGLDQEQPGDQGPGSANFDGKLVAAVAAGEVPQARLDDMARRILRAIVGLGLLTNPVQSNRFDEAAHREVARDHLGGSLGLEGGGDLEVAAMEEPPRVRAMLGASPLVVVLAVVAATVVVDTQAVHPAPVAVQAHPRRSTSATPPRWPPRDPAWRCRSARRPAAHWPRHWAPACSDRAPSSAGGNRPSRSTAPRRSSNPPEVQGGTREGAPQRAPSLRPGGMIRGLRWQGAAFGRVNPKRWGE